MIELDGSEGEGGGQILRSALALSILTGKPFKLINIRANRSKPGLQPQHVMCVKAAGTISGAIYKGASNGSSVLYFEPNAVKPGKYTFSIGTAGATALVLHTVAFPLSLRGTSPSEVTISGGTHNQHAPCYHFLETTWAAYLRRMGIVIELEMIRPGFIRVAAAIRAPHSALFSRERASPSLVPGINHGRRFQFVRGIARVCRTETSTETLGAIEGRGY
ncbi:MAG: RNA 3'-terminal phosphate cyclase [Gemmataceae bacterium]